MGVDAESVVVHVNLPLEHLLAEHGVREALL